MNIVAVENLSKTFILGLFRQKKITALRNVSFHLKEGEILALIGPNGSGKTTLIRILSTLILPSAGLVQICGQDVVKNQNNVKGNLALIMNDDRSFFWRLTCYENLRFFCILNNLSRKNIKDEIEQISKKIFLQDFLQKRYDRCSTGMKRKLSIARALLSKPKLLLLDEPTNSLDLESAQSVRNLLREYVQEQKMSAIYVTHNIHEIKSFADQVGAMKEGAFTLLAEDEKRRLFASV